MHLKLTRHFLERAAPPTQFSYMAPIVLWSLNIVKTLTILKFKCTIIALQQQKADCIHKC